MPLAHPFWIRGKQNAGTFQKGCPHQKTFPSIQLLSQPSSSRSAPPCQPSLCSHINTHQMSVLPCMTHSLHKIKNHHKAAWPNMEVFKLCSSYSPPDFAQTCSTVGSKPLPKQGKGGTHQCISLGLLLIFPFTPTLLMLKIYCDSCETLSAPLVLHRGQAAIGKVWERKPKELHRSETINKLQNIPLKRETNALH